MYKKRRKISQKTLKEHIFLHALPQKPQPAEIDKYSPWCEDDTKTFCFPLLLPKFTKNVQKSQKNMQIIQKKTLTQWRHLYAETAYASHHCASGFYTPQCHLVKILTCT